MRQLLISTCWWQGMRTFRGHEELSANDEGSLRGKKWFIRSVKQCECISWESWRMDAIEWWMGKCYHSNSIATVKEDGWFRKHANKVSSFTINITTAKYTMSSVQHQLHMPLLFVSVSTAVLWGCSINPPYLYPHRICYNSVTVPAITQLMIWNFNSIWIPTVPLLIIMPRRIPSCNRNMQIRCKSDAARNQHVSWSKE